LSQGWLTLIKLCLTLQLEARCGCWMRLHCLWIHFQVSFLCCCHHKSQSLHPLAPTLKTWSCHSSYASSSHYLTTVGLSFHVLWLDVMKMIHIQSWGISLLLHFYLVMNYLLNHYCPPKLCRHVFPWPFSPFSFTKHLYLFVNVRTFNLDMSLLPTIITREIWSNTWIILLRIVTPLITFVVFQLEILSKPLD